MKEKLMGVRKSDCTLCPLHKTAEHVCLMGEGKVPADIMLVGEAPGEREEYIHKPFQGRAGKMLDSLLYTFNLPRTSIYISNAVKCRPPDNATPKEAQIEACLRYLRREIKYVKPKVIVALGKVATVALTGDKSPLHSLRKQVLSTRDSLPKAPVIVTYHPAAVLRNDNLVDSVVKDFEDMLDFLDNGPPKKFKMNYVQVDGLDEIPGLMEAKVVAIDLETDGFDPFLRDRDIISVQISLNMDTGYYIRYDEEIKKELRDFFKNYKGRIVNQNLKFDLKWLIKKVGIKIPQKIGDTLLAAHLLDENAMAKDLDTLALEHLGMPPHKGSVSDYAKKHKVPWREVPLEIAVPYGCEDTIKAFRLNKKFKPLLEEQGLTPLYKLQLKVLKLFTEMEIDGFAIDVARIDELADRYEAKILELDKVMKGLNVNSPKQVNELLYGKYKLPPMGKPKEFGEPPSFDTAEATLLKLIASPVTSEPRKLMIRRILEQRENRKLLSHYILGLGDFLRDGNLIHPNFKITGTVTGRPSCSDPNLQQIPRDGDIKELFISRFKDGGVLMQIDVSQAELRWAAHLSKERTLLRYFKEGLDVHRMTASKVLKIPPEEVTEAQRKRAKIVNFGILYGASKYMMSEKGIGTIEEAEEFIRSWKEEFSGWVDYERKLRRQVIESGFVTSLFGRRRRLPIMDSTSKQGKEALRQAINSPIQGGVADFTLMCGVNAHRILRMWGVPKVHFVNVVHDCWVIDTVEENVPLVAKTFRHCFTQPDFGEFDIKLRVPMEVEVKVGKNWKHMKVLEE